LGLFDVIAGVIYYLPQGHNLVLRARYDYNRFTDTDPATRTFDGNGTTDPQPLASAPRFNAPL
jgi:cytolysin (calcineurin-like family phosphatase)